MPYDVVAGVPVRTPKEVLDEHLDRTGDHDVELATPVRH